MSDFEFMVQVSKQNFRNLLPIFQIVRETIESSMQLQLRIPKSKELPWENVSQFFMFLDPLKN